MMNTISAPSVSGGGLLSQSPCKWRLRYRSLKMLSACMGANSAQKAKSPHCHQKLPQRLHDLVVDRIDGLSTRATLRQDPTLSHLLQVT
jgi:hypothetical protein